MSPLIKHKLHFPFLALAFLALAAVSGHPQERAAVHRVPPTYPQLARQLNIGGSVIVTATVDAAGKVIKAESTSGNKLLVPAAIEAVKQWRFAPGESTGTVNVSITFAKD